LNQNPKITQSPQPQPQKAQNDQYQSTPDTSAQQFPTKTDKPQHPPIKVSTTEEHIIQSTEPQSGSKVKRSKGRGKGKKIFLVVILFLFISAVSSSAIIYAVTYKKIDIRNKPLQKKVAHFVMSNIPFAPITPEYILEKTAITHQKVTKTSYDLSLAVNTDQGSLSDFGFDNFDMKMSGAVDFTNPNNILASAILSITNDFGMEFRTKENILYFKISKFPTEIFTLLNVDPESLDPLMNRWIMYDTSTLESEARSFLDEELITKQQESPGELTENIIDEKILNNIKVGDDVYNGYKSYKLEFIANGEMIDYLVEKASKSQSKDNLLYTYNEEPSTDKPSDYIKELKVLAWIEKETFYARKAIFSTTIVSDENSFDFSNPLGFFPTGQSDKTQMTITGAMLLDNFNNPVSIETPQDPMQMEEVYEIFNKIIYEDSSSNTSFPAHYPEESISYPEATAGADIEIYYPEFDEFTYPEATADSELEQFPYKFGEASDVLGWFGKKLDEAKR
jgi:hypothetical protein